MNRITQKTATEIGFLCLAYKEQEQFTKDYDVIIGGTTMCRDFDIKDLFCSIMLLDKSEYATKGRGYHINIMNDGDVFARKFPYYDGSLELIAVYNQRKIANLVIK